MLFRNSESNQVGEIFSQLLSSILNFKLVNRFKPFFLRKRWNLLAAELPLDMLGIDDPPNAHVKLLI
ncbi:hypothetical protein D3C77_391810 [compost metagenome]